MIDQITHDAKKAETALPTLARMCDLLEVSRSGYYAWQARQTAGPGPRAARRTDLAVKIRVAHDASHGVNGAPRITADLREAGEVVSIKTVAKLMRHEGIRGISPRPWHPVTTITDEAVHHIPDLVERRFDQGRLNAGWTSDITYLKTGEGWLYLAGIRDGHSRRVIGYQFADHLHTNLVETATPRCPVP
ncbi:IS3 family transposase ISAar26 [bioreactor metagenome]|uniref:IS3 family transposase ISAar26 n=1 Tax=bioreactor metagenome TaxID=1076179 RepID=A0A644XQR0_9ZZZZ